MAAIRPELRHLDLAKLTDRLAFYALWESRLHWEYPELEWRLTASDMAHLGSYDVSQFLADGGTGLSSALQGNWPTLLDLMPGFEAHSRCAHVDAAAFTKALPWPLQLIWNDRPDLKASHDIRTDEGRIGLLRWWFLFGHREHPRVRWSVSAELSALDWHVQGRLPWQHLHQLATSFDACAPENGRCGKPLPYVPFRVCSSRTDLRQAFDLSQPTGCDALLAWWAAHGVREYGPLVSLFNNPLDEQPGMNIVGYARSVIGIAEDVRMAAQSAGLAGIPFAVVDAPMPGPQKSDHSLDGHIVERPTWPVSLYCLPPTETIRLGMEGGRPLLDSGTYNIGGWHWELPVWPDHLTEQPLSFPGHVRRQLVAVQEKPACRCASVQESLPHRPGCRISDQGHHSRQKFRGMAGHRA